MRKPVRAAVFAAMVFAAFAAGPAHADPIPLPVGEAGLSITIDAPDTFRAGVPYRVSGFVYAVFALPVVVEVSQGLPHVPVDIIVDGAYRGTLETDDNGRYEVEYLLTGELTTHTVRAAILRGTPIEVSSATRSATLDRTFTALNLDPNTLSLDLGASQQVRALAFDADGRQQDVTASAVWATSNPAVATVNGGLVQATGGGAATVTATWGGLEASMPVNVVDNGR
jgi:hypothetical protein